MNSIKRRAGHNVLLWAGLGLVGVALVLALAGTVYGIYSASQNNTALQSSNAASPSTEETSDNTGASSSGSIAPSGVPSSLSEARDAFEQAVSRLDNSNLEVKDVMEFANNYYAQVRESETGIGAMELLIDKRAGQVRPEPGPNMMWNTKYGMMSGRGMMGPNGGGMMGTSGMMGDTYQPPQASSNDRLPITPEDATQIAKDYISRNSLGTDTEEPDQFYGYYTLHTKSNGEVNGMLSVNGYTGAVWYHTWHGPFIAMEEDES